MASQCPAAVKRCSLRIQSRPARPIAWRSSPHAASVRRAAVSRNAAHARGDDRHAGLGSLQEHRSGGLLVAGQGEHVEPCHQPRGVGAIAGQVDLALDAVLRARRLQPRHDRLAVADDQQVQFRVLPAQRRDRLEQVEMALGLAQHGHAADDDIVVAEAQVAAYFGA